MWGRKIEGGVLEDPYNEPPEDVFIWVKTKISRKTNILKSNLKRIPVGVDGKTMDSKTN